MPGLDDAKGLIGGIYGGIDPSILSGIGTIMPGQPNPGTISSSVTAAPPVPSYATPQPGVSGVTPGAVERRLSGLNSMPPTAQADPSRFAMPPTAQAQRMSLGGNTVGADPRSIQDPVAMIRMMLNGAGGRQNGQ